MLFRIFDAEFEVDMLDYDYMIKVEDELEAVKTKLGAISEKAFMDGMRQSVLIRDSTKIIHEFFEVVFGEGAAEKIFKGKINYGEALKAFGEYVLQKNEHSGDDIKDINDEYMPKIQASTAVSKGGKRAGNNKQPGNVQQFNGNRAQRRNAQYNNKKGKNNPNRYHK